MHGQSFLLFRRLPRSARHCTTWPRRVIVALGILVFLASPCFAAGHVLSGVVLDSVNHAPLIGATVMVSGAARQTGGFADEQGRFHFSIDDHGALTILVRYIGYREKSFSINLERDVSISILLAPLPLELNEVTVTEDIDRMKERSGAQSVTVLSAAEIDKLRGQTLGETLSKVNGVTVIQTGPSISKPVIRGLHSDRILVLNAGVRQEGQQWGGEHAPEIDPFAAGKIEVLRGASGIEYGAGAIGGVIKIEPRELHSVPGVEGTLSLNGFSNNRQGSGALMLEAIPAAIPGLGVEAQGSYRRAGDASTPDYVIGNTGFEELDGSLLAAYRTERFRTEVYLSHFGTRLGIYRGSHVGNYDDLMRAITLGRPPVTYDFTYDILPPKQDVRHNLASWRTFFHLANAGELEVRFGAQQNRRREYDAHRRWFDTTAAAGPAAFDLQLTTYDADVRFRHQPVGRLVGSAGVTVSRQTNVGNSLSFLIPNYRMHAAGVFATESLVFDGIIVQAGGRWDWSTLHVYPYDLRAVPDVTLDRSGASAAVGVVYTFLPDWTLGANASTAWRAPSVNELFSNGVHHGTAQYETGDPALTPERSVTLDATLRYSSAVADLELSAYLNGMTGFIYLYPDPSPTLTLSGLFPTFRYHQADAVIRGLEGTASLQLTDWLRTGIGFSLLRGELTSTGEPLYQMPADRLRLVEHVHLPELGALHEAYAEISAALVRRQDRFPRGVDYVDPPAGYGLLDATLGATFAFAGHDLGLMLSVNNIFDKVYRDALSRFRYYVDEPGRNVVLRLRIPFTIVSHEQY
jgi:iron complex outermembrane recepter protein